MDKLKRAAGDRSGDFEPASLQTPALFDFMPKDIRGVQMQ